MPRSHPLAGGRCARYALPAVTRKQPHPFSAGPTETDPGVAAAAVSAVASGSRGGAARTAPRAPRPDAWSLAVQGTTALAVVALTIDLGFRELPIPMWLIVAVQVAAVVVYVVHRAREVWLAAERWRALRRRSIDLIPLLAAVLYVVFELEMSQRHVLHTSTIYIAALSVFFFLRLGIAAAQYNLAWSQSRLHPARLLTGSFLVLVGVGGGLLSLPVATHPHVYEREGWTIPRHVLDCFFTATSATCVTGLAVYDTGGDFTLVGQIIILALIQLGGLGIMIFGSVLGLLARKQLSLRQSLLMQDAISYRTLGDLKSVVTFIVVATLLIEAIGAVCLYGMWQPVEMSESRRWFYSVFHSISAFCNAGFGLHNDSLVRYRADFRVYTCIMPLIVIGGVGFPVLFELKSHLKTRVIRRVVALVSKGQAARPPRRRLSLHTRTVLATTAALVLAGTVGFFLLETRIGARAAGHTGGLPAGALGGDPPAMRLLGCLFQSVTCRTAGFNTAPQDVHALSPASHFFAALLMFMGGSPASTAGGVKTTAVAILVLATWSTIRGRTRVEAFGRTIPQALIHRAGVVMAMMFTACGLTVLALCMTETAPLQDILFEAVSACGTVGLSTGLTPELSIPGRVIIMLAMFAGRLGPLTVMIAVAGTRRQAEYEYPEEDVVIG